MKLLTTLSLTAVAGAALISLAPSDAQVGTPSWIKGGCNVNGCQYFRIIRRNYPFILTKYKDTYQYTSIDGFIIKDEEEEWNCQEWKHRHRHYASNEGKPYKWSEWFPWRDIMPGSVNEISLRAVCG